MSTSFLKNKQTKNTNSSPGSLQSDSAKLQETGNSPEHRKWLKVSQLNQWGERNPTHELTQKWVQKRKYIPISLTNTDIKTLNKMLAN